MIRRAQAEALLKLAEALEECERNGLKLGHTYDGVDLFTGNSYYPVCTGMLEGNDVRILMTKIYPKSEDAE